MPINPDWPRPTSVIGHHEKMRSILESQPDLAEQLMAAELFAEINQQTVLMLVASIEATFQVDLRGRLKRKLSDKFTAALRRQFRTLMKTRRPRIEIESILDVWRDETGLVRKIGVLKQVIEYRHWLAHGRYWHQKSGLKGVIDPADVWLRWEAVRDGIAAFTDFPIE